jgi:hypothetical protein
MSPSAERSGDNGENRNHQHERVQRDPLQDG